MAAEWWTVVIAVLGFIGTIGSVCITGGILIGKQREHGDVIKSIKDEMGRSREEFRKDMQETREEFSRDSESIRNEHRKDCETMRVDAKVHCEEDKKAFAVLFDRTATHTAEIGFAKEQVGRIQGWLSQQPWMAGGKVN